MNIRITILGLLLGIAQFSGAQELRNSLAIGFDIFPRLGADVEYQINNNFSPEGFLKNSIQGKLEYSLNKHWELSGLYTFSYFSAHSTNLAEGGEETNNKQKLSFDLGYKLKRFDNDLRLSNRFRYQFVVDENSKAKECLRDKISLDYKMSRIFMPYIAVEPYFNLHTKEINYLRFYFGNELNAFHMKMELYYIAEFHIRDEGMEAQYMIGTSMRINYRNLPLKH